MLSLNENIDKDRPLLKYHRIRYTPQTLATINEVKSQIFNCIPTQNSVLLPTELYLQLDLPVERNVGAWYADGHVLSFVKLDTFVCLLNIK